MSIRGGGYLTIHLGMTGKLLLGGQPGKHTHAILTLDRGVLLYDDSRQFGRLQYSEEFPARIGKLGPEPLEVAFEDFAARMKRRNTRIKALLLNQDFLRGIGNIYADEALFRAGIHPLAMASTHSRRSRAAAARRDRGGAVGSHRGGRLVYLGLCRRGGPEGLFSIQPPGLPAHRRAMCDLRRQDPARVGGPAFISLLSEMPEALDWILLKPKCMASPSRVANVPYDSGPSSRRS